MKSTLKAYEEAKYPQETLESLAWLESSCEHLSDLLESYRHIQPDGKLFSVASIVKISRLHGLSQLFARHEEERDYHQKMIENCNHEIHCIENGMEITCKEHHLVVNIRSDHF